MQKSAKVVGTVLDVNSDVIVIRDGKELMLLSGENLIFGDVVMAGESAVVIENTDGVKYKINPNHELLLDELFELKGDEDTDQEDNEEILHEGLEVNSSVLRSAEEFIAKASVSDGDVDTLQKMNLDTQEFIEPIASPIITASNNKSIPTLNVSATPGNIIHINVGNHVLSPVTIPAAGQINIQIPQSIVTTNTQNPITAIAVSSKGNQSPLVHGNVIIGTHIDQTVVDITDGGNTDNIIGVNEVKNATIKGSIDPMARLDALVITDTNNHTIDLDARHVTVDKKGNFTLDNIDVSNLTDGQLVVTAKAIDSAGNSSASQDLIMLDTHGTFIPNQVPNNAIPIATPMVVPGMVPMAVPSQTPVGNLTPNPVPQAIPTPGQSPNLTPPTPPNPVPQMSGNQTPNLAPTLTPIATPQQVPILYPNQVPNAVPYASPIAVPNQVPSQILPTQMTPAATPVITIPAHTNSTTPTVGVNGTPGNIVHINVGNHLLSPVTIPASGHINVQVPAGTITPNTSNPITAVAVSPTGNQSLTAQGSITVDTHIDKTIVDITDGGNKDNVINAIEASSANVKGIIDPTSKLDSLSVTDVNGQSITIDTKNIMVDKQGNFIAKGVDVTNLTDGELRVIAKATDLAGNSSSSTDTITLKTQISVPKVELEHDTSVRGDNHDFITKNPHLHVTSESGAKVEYSTDGGKTWTQNFNPTHEGKIAVEVRQIDKNANVSQSTHFDFIYDHTKPTFTFNHIADSNTHIVSISGHVDEKVSHLEADVILDGTNKHRQLATPTIDTNGNWHLTTSSLPDGKYTIKIGGVDEAGNYRGVFANSNSTMFSIDTTAPSAPIVTIKDDIDNDGILSQHELGHSKMLAVDIALPSDAKVGDVLNVSSSPSPHTLTQADINAGHASSFIVPSSLQDGHTYDATATLIDKVGNVSQIGKDSVIIDSSNSITADMTAATDTGSSHSDNITKDTTPDIVGKTDPNADVIIKDGSTILATLKADANGNYHTRLSSLPDGIHKLDITSTDSVGNISKITKNIIIDTTITAKDDNSTIDEDNKKVISGNVITNDDHTNGETVTPQTLKTAYGEYDLKSDGSYTFKVNNLASQSLAQGTSAIDTLTYEITDRAGNITTATLTTTITGSNDGAVITTKPIDVTEDIKTVATVNLSVLDVDKGENYFKSETFKGSHGSAILAQDGTLVYTLDSKAAQHLNVGESITDVIKVTSVDGTTKDVSVTIHGTNDKPVINAITAQSINEDGSKVLGTITSTDIDNGDRATYATTTTQAGFTLKSDGSYVLDPTDKTFQHLAVGEHQVITIPVVATDTHSGVSTANDLVITVIGTNDIPKVSAPVTLSVGTEDKTQTITTAQLLSHATDVDATDRLSISNLKVDHGSVTVDSSGTIHFTPTPDYNGQAQFTYDVIDGHQGIVHTSATTDLAAVQDAAVIGGVDTGSLTEDKNITSSYTLHTDGQLSITDVDSGEAKFQPESVKGTYGTVDIVENGKWNYNADNKQTAIQNLNTGDTITDTITVKSVDGTKHNITITIDGVTDNREPTVTSSSIAMHEDGTYSFSSNSFGYKDKDGDALHHITVTELPKDGDLKLGSKSVSVSQNIATSELSKLTFTPSKNFNGDTSFKYTANDGKVDSTEAKTTIQIDSVVDKANVDLSLKAAHEVIVSGTHKDGHIGAVLGHSTSGLSSFSLEFTVVGKYVPPSTTGQGPVIVNLGNSSNSNILSFWNPGNLTIGSIHNHYDKNTETGINLGDGHPHRITATLDSNHLLTIYDNGKQATSVGNFNDGQGLSSDMHIIVAGKANGSNVKDPSIYKSNEHYDGQIFNVAMTGKELSSAQVQNGPLVSHVSQHDTIINIKAHGGDYKDVSGHHTLFGDTGQSHSHIQQMPIDLSLTTPPADALIHISAQYSPSDSKDVVTKAILTGLLHGVKLDDGHGHTAIVGVDGKVDITGWNHDITAQLTGIKTNMNLNLAVTTQDPNGAVVVSSDNEGLRIDPHNAIPAIQTIAIDNITHDDIINAAESHQQIMVKGTPLTNVQDGDSVTINVNKKDFTGTIKGGTFAIKVDGSELIKDDHIKVSINGDKAVHHYGVDTTATLHITSSSHITPVEHHHGFTISGTSDAENGQKVILSYGQHSQTAIVQDGKWHANVSQAEAQTLSLGKLDIKASVLDKAGNKADNIEHVTVDKGNLIPDMNALHLLHSYGGNHLIGEFPTHDKDGNTMKYALEQGNGLGDVGKLVVSSNGGIDYYTYRGHHSQTDTFAIKVTDGSANEAVKYLTLGTNSMGHVRYHSEISDIAPSTIIHDEALTDHDLLQYQLDTDLADTEHHITKIQKELHDAEQNHHDIVEIQAKLDEFTQIKEHIVTEKELLENSKESEHIQTEQHDILKEESSIVEIIPQHDADVVIPNLDNVADRLEVTKIVAEVPHEALSTAATLLEDTTIKTLEQKVLIAVENQEVKEHIKNPDASQNDADKIDETNLLDNVEEHIDYIPDIHNKIQIDEDHNDGTGLTS